MADVFLLLRLTLPCIFASTLVLCPETERWKDLSQHTGMSGLLSCPALNRGAVTFTAAITDFGPALKFKYWKFYDMTRLSYSRMSALSIGHSLISLFTYWIWWNDENLSLLNTQLWSIFKWHYEARVKFQNKHERLTFKFTLLHHSPTVTHTHSHSPPSQNPSSLQFKAVLFLCFLSILPIFYSHLFKPALCSFKWPPGDIKSVDVHYLHVFCKTTQE